MAFKYQIPSLNAQLNPKSQLSSSKPRSPFVAWGLVLLWSLVLVIWGLPQPANAALGINPQINFQARLFNAAGAVVPDGNYNIEFKIYQDGDGCNPTSGTPPCGGTLKWTEAWLNNNTQGVVVRNGYFSVQLGSITSLSTVDFNQSVNWLSMNVGNTNPTCTPFSNCSGDGEMKPFQRFGSNAYSFNSDRLGGLDKSQFTQLAQGLQTDASTTNASIAINKTGGTANILDLQRGGSNVVLVDNNGTSTFQATGNNSTLLVKQTANGSPSSDIFNVLGANGTTKFISVTSTAANAGAVTVQSIGASNALTLDSGSGIIALGSNTTTIQKSGTALTIDLNSASSSTLTVENQGAGQVSLLVKSSTSTALIVQTEGGENSLVFDGSTKHLKVFENVATPSAYAEIYYAAGEAVFAASTGNTRVGSGSGNIIMNTSSPSNTLSYTHSGTLASVYSGTDATITRTFTGGTNAAGGAVLKVVDSSSANGGVNINPTLLLLNQASTVGTISGNLIDAQLAGVSMFSVNTAGILNAVSGTFSGSSSLTLGTASSSTGAMLFKNGTNTNIVTIQSGVTAASGYTLTLPTALGSSGDCIKDTTGAGVLGFGACGGGSVTDLQTAYDGSSSPATILLADAKNFVINAADTTTDSNILFNLQCTTCSANGGRFAVQSGAVDVLTISPNGGAVLFKNSIDSTTAFQIQTAGGSPVTVLNVDTSNQRVGIGTPSPGSILTVAGAQPASSAVNGTNATGTLSISGGKGGNTSGTSHTAGVGATALIQGGDGGNATAGSGSSTAGVGGSITIQAGAGGVNSNAANANANGGDVTIQGGAGGTGGTGGSYGNVLIAASGGILKVGGVTTPTLANVRLFVNIAEVATTIRVGDATNGVEFSGTSAPIYRGTARPTKRISGSPEFEGAVLRGDGSNNTGTMTTAFDATNFHNYYKWTTSQGSNQDFDVAIRVPVPQDFSALVLSPSLCFYAYTSDTTNGTLTAAFTDSANVTITLSNTSYTPGSASTWTETCRTISGTPTITAGGFITIRMTIQSPQNGDVRLGQFRLDYLSGF